MIKVVDGTCWMCGQRCESRWCTPDCHDAWELDLEWIKRAAELAVMGRVELHKMEAHG